MSHNDNVVQASSYDRRISLRLHRIPCGRCYAVIEYDRGADWSVVSKLVNEHWKACPAKPHAWPARMACTPPSPPDTVIILPPPAVSNEHSNSITATESVGSVNGTWISSGCERKRRTLEQRKVELEQDEYAKNVTTKSVVCTGCDREISLDKRSKYYPGLWLKHRGKCPGIEKLECAKAKVTQVSNGTSQVPRDVVTPALGANSYGEVVQRLADRYESQTSVITHRLVLSYNLEDPFGEDDDEDGDSQPQESFPRTKTITSPCINPALNSEFYTHNNSDEWAYRYATKDEISSNFRGQGEPLYRLSGGRPLTHLGLQKGGPYGKSVCVMENRVEHAVSLSR
ncbi:hypothetical protein JVU11DRAFT_6729 [Chiua virens]|nr:hypothetical protein JVU11DRAFT_6729 [Chiua virens]